MKQLIRIWMITLLVGLAACVSTENKGGQIIQKGALEQLKANESTKDNVIELLGSPSSASDFGPERWYYISRTTRTTSVLRPEVAELTVVEIEFDETGRVKSMNHFTKEDMKNTKYSEDRTPTAGQKYTIIQQLLGNVGRFNKEPADRGQ